ncbi:hypothetical protein G7048_03910 [Diaphorobacter sp. HDW4B]|uniref:hypothetical protein n=1 Tax=Diaphorobacter sp. HDW4B TaxID=2714925 RepID=UPI00140BC0B0|nr:hypothetical protein [Diaphorobacter sp. HDW4B]QIL69591.1 hypothetical protein G7048_03910 [Diaphorobacter sp. HDW4B]
MSEIIARPAAGARATHAQRKATKAVSLPVAQQAPAQSERDTLALQVAEILQTMYMAAAYYDDGGPRTNNNTHFDVVDHLLGLLLAPEHHERGEADPECGDIHEHLTQIADELQDGASLMDEHPLANLAAPMQAMYAAMAHRAAEYADRLFMAYCADSLDDLRHLTTFAGMRPFRDRPQPSIRRVEEIPVTTATEAHKAGEKGRLLALQCTWDIDAVANAVTSMADEIVGDSLTEGLLRCYGTRIMSLNGALMSYLDQDPMTAKDMHRKVFGGAKAFEGAAA